MLYCLVSDPGLPDVKLNFSSAARFGNLLPFGQLFEPFGDQSFVLATLKFGDLLVDFSKIVKKKLFKLAFSNIFRALM